MKKKAVFYIINVIWIIYFFIKAYQENESHDDGLAALGSVGDFYLYAILFILGIVVILITTIINIIFWRVKKKC